jgi:hypothetical protein
MKNKPTKNLSTLVIALFGVLLLSGIIFSINKAFAATSSTTITVSGNDTHLESDDTFSITGTQMPLGRNFNTPQDHFFLFDNIVIDQGATINSSSIAFTIHGTGGNAVHVQLAAHDVDSGVTPTDGTEFSSKASGLTTAIVDWNSVPTGSFGDTLTSPDIATVIQEIVDRPSWVSGNDILIWIGDNASEAYSNRTIITSDYTGGEAKPTLDIDYTNPPAGTTLSGNAYQSNETTAIDGSTINKTVTLLVDGAATACSGGACTAEITTSNGAWSISGITLVSGDIVTVYLDNETEEATTVFISDGTAQTNVDLFQNAVILRADTSTVSNTTLSTGDGGDDDIKYEISTGNLTVDSGFEIHVWTGDTFDPGGTVTTNSTGGDLHLDDSATAYLDTTTSTIGLDVIVDTGATLNIDANSNIDGGDITMTGTGVVTTSTGTPTVTLSGTGTIGGGTGAATFYNLSLDTVGTTTLDTTLNINNDLTLGDGTNAHTLEVETNDDVIDVAGSVTINANGTLTASSTAAFTVATNWTNNGTLNEGTGTITLDSAATALLDSGCATSSSCTAENFYNLIISKSTSTDTVTLTSTDLRIAGTLTITTGTLTQGAFNIQADGTSAVSIAVNGILTNISTGNLALGGSFANAGTTTFQGDGATCGSSDNIYITSTSGGVERSWTGAGTFNFNDVNVQDQGGSAAITVYSGTNVSGNDTNWTFLGCYDNAKLMRHGGLFNEAGVRQGFTF